MDYKLSYLLFLIGLGLGIVSYGLFYLFQAEWIAICGVVILLLSGIQAHIFVRCPDCGRSLLIRGKKAEFCPGCGTPLDW